MNWSIETDEEADVYVKVLMGIDFIWQYGSKGHALITLSLL
jgi:hypothetical protein